MTEEEILAFIKNTVEKHPLTYSMILFSKQNHQIRDYIYEHTKNFNIYDKFQKRSRVYCVLHNITDFPKCKVCGKKIIKNVKSNDHGGCFSLYCSPKCENKDPDVITKLNNTNLQKYGVQWTFQSENNKSKSLKTMNQKYGVDYAQQNKDIKQKSYNTMIEKYGTKYSTCSETIKNKIIKSSRSSEYDKFLSSKYLYPLFSREDYIENGNYVQYKWKCLKCGNEFESFIDMSWFKQGQNRSYARCEKCYPRSSGTSSGEEELLSFIKSIYSGTIEPHKKCLGNSKYKMEIDIFLPQLNIGFEYNGMYWHSEKCGKPNDYHLFKTELSEKSGIKLIHIFESEWMSKREIVKSRIKNMIGLYEKIVYARKCKIIELDKRSTDEFINRTHLQGECQSSINLGLEYCGILVSVMTFGKSRFNKKYEWELLRFSNELGYHVIGGAGKLLKYFERNYHPKSLISYADRRWSSGNLYFNLGFNHIGNSKPNYWYFKNMKIYSRIRFQKHKLNKLLPLFDKNKTEVQNMFDNGYNRIFDCGNMVFCKKYI